MGFPNLIATHAFDGLKPSAVLAALLGIVNTQGF